MGVNNSMLILSISPESVDKPYYFNSTHKKVYSLEELMYHCYYHWKQSIDDFLSGKIELWISEDLKLTYLASRIEKIKDRESTITAQYTAFLNIIDYFEKNEINSLGREVYSWENMDQWKKYKEKGDYALDNERYIEAIKFYMQALDIVDDIAILNNMGVAYMKQEKYSDAMLCFEKAHFKEPNNENIIINIIETLMLQGQYDTAQAQLEKFAFMKNNSKAYNLYGELQYIQQNYEKALYYFKKSVELENNPKILMKISDIYVKLDKYSEAFAIMESIEQDESSEYYYKYAELNFKFGKIKEAIKQAEKSIGLDGKSIPTWILLVQLYKKSKNIPNAERALLKIFEIDPDNEQAKLEYATLKKSQGFIRDYQEMLKGILNKWKQRYREENDL